MAPSRRLGNRWEVIEPIAEGGQSHVFMVRDVSGEYLGQLVLKRLRNHKKLGSSRLLAKLSHHRLREEGGPLGRRVGDSGTST